MSNDYYDPSDHHLLIYFIQLLIYLRTSLSNSGETRSMIFCHILPVCGRISVSGFYFRLVKL